jgi:hypothetical protein
VIYKNGQTQETSRGLNSSDIFDQSERLGRFQDSSRVNGIEQVRLDQVDCSTQDNSRRTSKHGNITAGKIVERLKRLEDKHISHLKTHQNLLKSQFDQVKEEEESFRKEVQQLEEEIYNLVSSEGKSQLASEEDIKDF